MHLGLFLWAQVLSAIAPFWLPAPFRPLSQFGQLPDRDLLTSSASRGLPTTTEPGARLQAIKNQHVFSLRGNSFRDLQGLRSSPTHFTDNGILSLSLVAPFSTIMSTDKDAESLESPMPKQMESLNPESELRNEASAHEAATAPIENEIKAPPRDVHGVRVSPSGWLAPPITT